MAKTITLAGQKGGTGKSTIAVHLAAYWAELGHRVLLLDADAQGTTLTWSEEAAERGAKGPTVTAMGDNLRAQLPELRRGFDLVIVDTPGRQSKRLAGALVLSDLALIPCKPSSADIWALTGTLELVEQAQSLCPTLKARILHNEVHRSVLAQTAQDAMHQSEIPSLCASLGRRVAFAEAMAAGQGVSTYAPASLAAHELRRVAEEIEDLLELERWAPDAA